jgi:hypothetical protein
MSQRKVHTFLVRSLLEAVFNAYLQAVMQAIDAYNGMPHWLLESVGDIPYSSIREVVYAFTGESLANYISLNEVATLVVDSPACIRDGKNLSVSDVELLVAAIFELDAAVIELEPFSSKAVQQARAVLQAEMVALATLNM